MVHSVRLVGSLVPLAAMFATQMINAGEELTFDYAGTADGLVDVDANGVVSRTPCRCGSESCRKWLPYDASL